MSQPNLEELVGKYVELRDKKKAIDDEAKSKTERITAVMDKIESILLLSFQTSGTESVRTAAGTAYKQTRTSAGVADWPAVLEFIKENQLWDMLERRVAKAVVEQYKEEHGELPPGVNYRSEVVVNVRRS